MSGIQADRGAAARGRSMRTEEWVCNIENRQKASNEGDFASFQGCFRMHEHNRFQSRFACLKVAPSWRAGRPGDACRVMQTIMEQPVERQKCVVQRMGVCN